MALNRLSLSDQMYEQLREDIILGKIKPGQRLTMREVQERFGVSSSPVREAFSRLAQDRFVENATNQGVRVIELSFQDVSDLLELCCMWDCQALENAMERSDRQALVNALQSAIRQQRDLQQMPELHYDEYNHVFYSFHEAIYSFSGNVWLIELARQHSQLLLLSDVQKDMCYPEAAVREHEAILDAIIKGDSALAVARVKEHRANEKSRFESRCKAPKRAD